MLKKLFESAREYKKETMKTPILVALEVAMECIIPFVIARLVNEVKVAGSFSVLVSYGILLIVMAALALTFGIVSGVSCATAAAGFAKNLRQKMFDAVQGYSFENIDNFVPSSLVTRMTTDVFIIQRAFMMLIRVAVRAPMMLIFSFVMAFIMGGRLAWIFIAVVPLMTGALLFLGLKVMPLFKKIFKKYDKMNGSIQENIKAIRVVKSFVREDYEKEKFNKVSQEVADDFTRAERILAYNGPIMQFFMYVNMVFVLSYGSYMVISSKGLDLDIGQISAMTTYSFMMLNALMMTSMIFAMLIMSREAIKRAVELLEEKPSLQNLQNPTYKVKDGSVDFENVSFKYSLKAKHRALKEVNLHIKSGETLGIVGGTGASKTTLVQLIARLYDTTEGLVKVGGIDVKSYDIKALRDQVAVVLQKNILFSGTIKDNLKWGNKEATDEEIVAAAKLACAHDFIMQMPEGYDTYIEQGGTNVSGGQRQRLCIARALLKRPKILIMDDSTSAVDTKTEAKIRQAMASFIPDVTKIIIGQRISSVEKADRIIVMEGGKIDDIGSHLELLNRNKIYQEIFQSQAKVGEDIE